MSIDPSPKLTPRDALQAERARFLMLWVVPIVAAALTSFAPQILNDGDTFWHVAAGRWMLAHQSVPSTDPFSFTFAGKPWLTHEWLSEVVMAVAWLAAGWSGVMLLTGLAFGALAAIMGAWLRRWLSPLPALCALAIGLACVAPGLLARPHLLVLPVAALWTVLLLSARAEGRAPSVWLVPLMALWANLHSSFVVGLVIAAALGLEMLLDAKAWRRDVLIGWTVVLGSSLVATLATPHGVDGLTFPLKVLNMKTLPVITEWRGPDFMKLEPLELALLAGLFALFWRGARLTAVRALLILGLVHMSLQHVRQEMLLGVIAPLLMAEPLARALGSHPPQASWRPFSRTVAPQTALGAALLASVIVARLVVVEIRADAPTAPITALAQVPADLRRQPVLNDYDFGGYLIFEGVRPYIDGRADMYGDDFVQANDQMERGENGAAQGVIARYHIRWAIYQPHVGIVGVMDNLPGWKRLYSDKYAIVWEKVAP